MKVKVDRVKNLSETLTALLDREHRSNQVLLSSLMELFRALQGDSADRRFQRLAGELKRLQERLELLTKLAEPDFLAEIRSEAEELKHSLADSRAAAVTSALIQLPSPSLNLFCDSLVDRLIEVTGAERGFLLFYIPESTEAEVIAAPNYQTRNLSLEEYDFSRTLLRDVFERGEPFLIEDASQDAAYSNEASVIRLGLMSVIAAPLKQSARRIGALYLENNSVARAFDEEDMKLLEAVGSFAVFYLQHARLLPVAFERDSRVFLDASKASTEIIGQDPKILEMLRVISRIADSPATVLIEGESGTGKDLVARALHYQSARCDRPFVAINCAAIPDNLLESELFGHEKGAFTGATERYIGRIERASAAA